MKVLSSAALAATSALALPAGAEAATLAATASCVAADAPVNLAGSGFTPGSTVTIAGAASASAIADAAGAVVATVSLAPPPSITPITVSLTASENVNAANTATLALPVVARAFDTNAPINGRPSQTTTWRFAGFVTGQPIFGHFRFGGQTRRNYRFGTAQGPCGTLVVRARRVPVKRLSSGKWLVQIDQRRRYSKAPPWRRVPFTLQRIRRPR